MEGDIKTSDGKSYWESACRFFRSNDFADLEGSYFLHNKNAATIRIGIMGCLITLDHRLQASVGQHPEIQVFKLVEKHVKTDTPCFFVVSPDIQRRYIDPSIPLIYVVKPAVEFTFSPEWSEGQISYARDSKRARQGEYMLRAAGEEPCSALQINGELRQFSELITDWIPAESDESFLKRLVDAIGLLQNHPNGKMTLTRAFECERTGRKNPFGMYELYAGMAGEYACSHFVCIRRGVFSVGVTPENVFEVRDRTLTVDVVAATCRSDQDTAHVDTVLRNNAKQRKEHSSSLANRQRRFEPFCREGSIRVVQDMHVKRTRNVSHLHSVFTGELLPHVTVFDLMGRLFPLLGARPSELSAIADAEAAPHRYYGGVVGHTNGGISDFFLNIRTALFLDDMVHVKVGVGVLRESDAHSELIETRDKLMGLLEAFQLWEASRESGACLPRVGNTKG